METPENYEAIRTEEDAKIAALDGITARIANTCKGMECGLITAHEFLTEIQLLTIDGRAILATL